MKREELRVKSKETVRSGWLTSTTARLVVRLARLAARLARLDFAEIEKYFSNPCNRHILSVLRDFSRVSILHSFAVFCTLLQSAEMPKSDFVPLHCQVDDNASFGCTRSEMASKLAFSFALQCPLICFST